MNVLATRQASSGTATTINPVIALFEHLKKNNSQAELEVLAPTCYQFSQTLQNQAHHFTLDQAADCLVQLSELIYAKSITLLPSPPPEETEIVDWVITDQEQQQQQLQRELLAAKYRDGANKLAGLPWLNRDCFTRQQSSLTTKIPWQRSDHNAFALVRAFHRLLTVETPVANHQVVLKLPSLRQTMQQLVQKLQKSKHHCLNSLLGNRVRPEEVVLIFLALLELTRVQLVRLNNKMMDLAIEVRFHTADEALAHIAADTTV